MSISPSYRIKCLFAGEASVGKSSIVHLLKHDFHDSNIEPTIGMNFAITKVELEKYKYNKTELPKFHFEENTKNCQIVKCALWDSAGSMRFRSIVQSYMRELDIVFLVFNMNDRNSWESLEKWKEEIEKYEKYERIPLYVLIGTKSDLRSYQVSKEEIDNLAKKWNVKRYIVSCVENNSSSMLKRILNNSVQDYHEHLLFLEKHDKEIPEHVTNDYCSREKYRLNIDVESDRSNFCCFQ